MAMIGSNNSGEIYDGTRLQASSSTLDIDEKPSTPEETPVRTVDHAAQPQNSRRFRQRQSRRDTNEQAQGVYGTGRLAHDVGEERKAREEAVRAQLERLAEQEVILRVREAEIQIRIEEITRRNAWADMMEGVRKGAGRAEEWAREMERQINQAEEERRQEEERLAREAIEVRRREVERVAREMEEERRREEERVQNEERARQANIAKREALRKAREAERQARLARIAKEEAAKTIQHVVSGSLMTFGAGLEIQNLITGFESCTVHIKNLPADVCDEEVAAIFLDQGIEARHFKILDNRQTADGKRTARIITGAETGQVISGGLDNMVFRDERLIFEVGAYNLAGGMSTSTLRDTELLTISWRGPSVRYVVEFPDMETTQRQVEALNGKMLMDRRARVQVNTPPPGRVIASFNPNSIVIGNLPPCINDDNVREFAMPCSSVKRLRQATVPNDDAHVIQALRTHIETISTTLASFEQADQNPDGIVTVKARFDSWDSANRVRQSLVESNFHQSMKIKVSAFWHHLAEPMQYTLTMSAAQYSAQKHQWTALISSIKDKKSCNLHINQDKSGVVRMRLSGQVKEAIGTLKVRVENLAAGEKVEGWHSTMGYSKSPFVLSIPGETGGYLRADHTRKTLKAYGTPQAIAAIRKLVESELARIASREFSSTLQKQSVGFFIRQGIATLKEMFGDGSIRFDAATRVITMSGGEEARHMLRSLVDQSLGESKLPLSSSCPMNETCPVCHDDVSNPLELGCKHVYCTPCMRHFLTNAEESGKFPLVCIGDESRCCTPIPIPVIQRFLPQSDFIRLLEVVFMSHVTRHPQELKNCRTPDCTQIYRSADQQSSIDSTVRCPSCFSTVCSSCHEGHEGMGCDAYKLSKDFGEQERLSEQWFRRESGRVRKCPNCQVPVEKWEGCNHISCRCGAHFCWRCLGEFSADKIYRHMDDAHGGIDDIWALGDDINYQEQEELLRQAEEARDGVDL